MTAMMAATAAVVTTARIVLGFLPVCVNAGMRLLTRSELFSPTSQSHQQNSRKVNMRRFILTSFNLCPNLQD
jgi:hypothetical protein